MLLITSLAISQVWGVSRTLFPLTQNIQINSVYQQVIGQDKFFFSGNVDLLIQDKIHIFADRMYLDLSQNFIRVEGLDDILVQDATACLFARSCHVDLLGDEVFVQGARVQVAEGFFSAQELYRDPAGIWWGRQVSYTPCDQHVPHWRLNAAELVYGKSSLELERVKFFINEVPVLWVPGVLVPLQKKHQSGLLIPKLSFDPVYGPGVVQEFYWYINEHADITTGIDWKNNRGIFGTGELRWAASPQHYGYFKGYGGYEEQVYVQRRDHIIESGRPQFWLQGSHTYGVNGLAGCDYVGALSLIDWGSDKRTGYEFFDRLEAVDDTAYNAFLLRGYFSKGLFQAGCDVADTVRKRFFMVPVDSIFSQEEQAQFLLQAPVDVAVCEFDTSSSVQHLPQLGVQYTITKIGDFLFKHYVLGDYVSMRNQELELIFLSGQLARQARLTPRATAESLRLIYEGDYLWQVPTALGTFSVDVQPVLNLRSQVEASYKQQSLYATEQSLFSFGAYRASVGGMARYMPWEFEVVDALGDKIGLFQPQVYANGAPFINQSGWPLFDRFDRYYPTGEIGVGVDYSIFFGQEQSLQGFMRQGIEMIPQQLWFPPRKTASVDRATPFSLGLLFQIENLSLGVDQEYCPINQKLLTSFARLKIAGGGCDLHVGYLFQDQAVARMRLFLAQVPHTFYLKSNIFLTNRVCVSYGGFFAAEENIVGWSGFKLFPIQHEIRLEYKGHCWGGYVGFEEKSYRQYNYNKCDRSFVISLYVDSLGSFAKKIKSNNELATGIQIK